jgi:hypothetical protein
MASECISRVALTLPKIVDVITGLSFAQDQVMQELRERAHVGNPSRGAQDEFHDYLEAFNSQLPRCYYEARRQLKHEPLFMQPNRSLQSVVTIFEEAKDQVAGYKRLVQFGDVNPEPRREVFTAVCVGVGSRIYAELQA